MIQRSLLEGLRAALARFTRKRRLRRDEQDLRGLSDHVLRDMGIGRSEILATVWRGRGAAPHDRPAAACPE